MTRIPDEFLDEVRRRVPVSTVASRHVKDMKKAGAEWKGLSPFNKERTPSFTVNDMKGLWHDFSSDRGGDIFALEQAITGCDFPTAVARCAEIVGLHVPGGQSAGVQTHSNARQEPRGAGPDTARDRGGDRPAEHAGGSGVRSSGGAARREIVEVYDYENLEGEVIYQRVRFNFKNADGSFEAGPDGKRKKTFGDRRPAPGETGVYVWALDADEFMRKGPGKDWIRFHEKHFVEWKFQERKTFDDSVDKILYRLPELWSEMLLGEDARVVHLTEGEKKSDTLVQWGCLATTAGGARYWKPEFTELLRGADVVIHQDNDLPGRESANKIAGLLHGVARRVRVLDLKPYWPSMPEKADITDWRDHAGGTYDRLCEIMDGLKDWQPAPHVSPYGAIGWLESIGTAQRYQYLIKRVIPRRQTVLIYGESQSGKTFETFDMAMHIPRGIDFHGQRVRQGGLIYVAYEKGLGFVTRRDAYRRFHGVDQDLPFKLLTKPIELWSDPKHVEMLIDDMLKISEPWAVPLEVVVIDTHVAATPGSSEIKSEEVTTIAARYRRIIERTGAGVWIVHHTNAAGGLRGSKILYQGIEAAIEISAVTDRAAGPVKDDNGRLVRRARVVKLSEGEAGFTWDFVLRQVVTGKDEYGEDETSCVSESPERPMDHDVARDTRQPQQGRPAGFRANKSEVEFFKAVLKALEDHGIRPLAELALPQSISRVVDWVHVAKAYRAANPNDEGETLEGRKRYADRIKKAVRRARQTLQNGGVIGVLQLARQDGTPEDSEPGHVLWATGKRIYGLGLSWPETPRLVSDRAAPTPSADQLPLADDEGSVF